MSLRYKSLIIITSIVMVLLLILLLFSHFIFTNFTKKNEEKFALENTQRVKNIIEREIAEFDFFSKGFAFWDLTYDFIDNPNKKYIDDNLKETDFNYFNLSFMIFTDLDGKEIYSKSYSFKDDSSFKILIKKILENHKIKETLEERSEIKGVFGSDGNEFIISVNPVYDNFKAEPLNGFLIAGREFDKIGLFKVKLNPNSSTYEVFSNKDSNSIDSKIKSSLILNNQLLTFNKERSELISYILLRNIGNQPEIVLKIVQSSEIFNLSKKAIILFATCSLIAIFILISIFIFLFERFVISKIVKLNENVGLLTANKRFNLNNSIRPDQLKSGDEIDALNINILKLLSVISHRNSLENLVIGVFNEYLRLNENNADDFIYETIKKTGSFSGSDRAGILLFSKNSNNAELFYFWYAPGTETFSEKHKRISLKKIEPMYDQIKTDGKYCLNSLKDLSEDQKKFKEFLISSETKSVLSIGMLYENNLIGLIKFDAIVEEKKWNTEDTVLLKTLTGILACAIVKFKSELFINI
ncbi:MAG: CHASE4 domain-containing protein [Candidatus Humimicrobiaceae bacterium]